jgi:3,4-dihydroxy 2-butanone 4-phosphate synthase/GTP cyclohydrolase II
MDDEDRENEGDLVMAAEKCTPEKLAFMIRHTSGVICVAMEEERLNALGLPQMVESKVDPTLAPTRLRFLCSTTPAARRARLTRPDLPQPSQENDEKLRTAFCVTCDLKASPCAGPHMPQRASVRR